MTITFAPNTIVDTVLRISLGSNFAAGSGIADYWGNLLDGDAPVNGSGTGYLSVADEDLPSGDGTAGGNAVFYVAGETPPRILSVMVDNNPDLGVSSLDSSPTRHRHDISAVHETGAVHGGHDQSGHRDAIGSTTSLGQISPAVTGSGTNTMTITFASGQDAPENDHGHHGFRTFRAW